ncbi:hypothetical protein L2E82_50826 [Cichorium intybus]|nr:hypothetical protein L2E82_50826 [Cichorium intybus]
MVDSHLTSDGLRLKSDGSLSPDVALNDDMLSSFKDGMITDYSSDDPDDDAEDDDEEDECPNKGDCMLPHFTKDNQSGKYLVRDQSEESQVGEGMIPQPMTGGSATSASGNGAPDYIARVYSPPTVTNLSSCIGEDQPITSLDSTNLYLDQTLLSWA